MKEVKFLLYTFYVAIYTSLWWAVFIFKGFEVGRGHCPIGSILLTLWSFANIVICWVYLFNHWNDDKQKGKNNEIDRNK